MATVALIAALWFPPPPTTDLEILAVLVSTTLWIAGYRTVEKVKGVAK